MAWSSLMEEEYIWVTGGNESFFFNKELILYLYFAIVVI